MPERKFNVIWIIHSVNHVDPLRKETSDYLWVSQWIIYSTNLFNNTKCKRNIESFYTGGDAIFVLLTAENWHGELDNEAQGKVHPWGHFGTTVDGKASF